MGNKDTRNKSSIAKNLVRLGLFTSMLFGCVPIEANVNPAANPSPGGETSTLPSEFTETPLPLPTETAAEIPTATQTQEPTATTEAAPVNMDEVIDLTKLSPEQIAMVNKEMIKRIEQFKNGEICSAELVKEKGFATSPDSTEREIHLGLISGSEDGAAMQVCILGNITKYNNDIYGKQFEYLYMVIGYEKKDGSRTSTVLGHQFGKNVLSNSPIAIEYDPNKLFRGVEATYSLVKERSQIVSFLNDIQNNIVTIQINFLPPVWPANYVDILKDQGRDPVLVEEWLKEYNDAIKLNKDLIMSVFIPLDTESNYLNLWRNETYQVSPLEVATVEDLVTSMNGRLLPTSLQFIVYGFGPK